MIQKLSFSSHLFAPWAKTDYQLHKSSCILGWNIWNASKAAFPTQMRLDFIFRSHTAKDSMWTPIFNLVPTVRHTEERIWMTMTHKYIYSLNRTQVFVSQLLFSLNLIDPQPFRNCISLSVFDGRTVCLAVDCVGVDPSRPTIPTKANLWPEGPESFHPGSTGCRSRYGERKMYACIENWKQVKVAAVTAVLRSPVLNVCFVFFWVTSKQDHYYSVLRSHVEKDVAC